MAINRRYFLGLVTQLAGAVVVGCGGKAIVDDGGVYGDPYGTYNPGPYGSYQPGPYGNYDSYGDAADGPIAVYRNGPTPPGATATRLRIEDLERLTDRLL